MQDNSHADAATESRTESNTGSPATSTTRRGILGTLGALGLFSVTGAASGTDTAAGTGVSTSGQIIGIQVIDTSGRDFAVEAGTIQTGAAQNVVHGHESNLALDAVDGATIGGGGFDDSSTIDANRVLDNFGTVAGGRNNQAGSDDGDPASAEYATVGGGQSNVATDRNTTVGGGMDNTASDNNATGRWRGKHR